MINNLFNPLIKIDANRLNLYQDLLTNFKNQGEEGVNILRTDYESRIVMTRKVINKIFYKKKYSFILPIVNTCHL